MSKRAAASYTESIFLRSDNGAELYFRGQLYSESSYLDEERGVLTRLRLFVTDNNEQVFSIISGTGGEKQRRHYIVAPEGEFYRISDGVQTLRLPLEALFAAVFGLCGIDPARAEDLKPAFEESLRMLG